jgi:hypothetical protein
MATAALAAVVAGCGGDGGATAGGQPTSGPAPASDASTVPTTTTPASTTPTATTGVPAGGTEAEGETAPEDQPGGGGDEEAIRVPATFVIEGAKVTPLAVAVPPFLPIELTVTAKDGRPHDVTVRGVPSLTVRLAAGGTASRRIGGLKAGEYAIVVDGRDSGSVLRVGATEPGP